MYDEQFSPDSKPYLLMPFSSPHRLEATAAVPVFLANINAKKPPAIRAGLMIPGKWARLRKVEYMIDWA